MAKYRDALGRDATAILELRCVNLTAMEDSRPFTGTVSDLTTVFGGN